MGTVGFSDNSASRTVYDNFIYRTITESNAHPSADDQSVTVAKNTKGHIITLTGSDADSDPLTFVLSSQPANGTLSGTAPNLLYTPNADYQGTDNFTFTVDDGRGGSDTGTVTSTVNDNITTADAKNSSGGGGGGCFVRHLFTRKSRKLAVALA